MANTPPSTVIHLERATIRVGMRGIVHVPLSATREVAAQKRVKLQEAADDEARLLGTRAVRVSRPRFSQITINLDDQQ